MTRRRVVIAVGLLAAVPVGAWLAAYEVWWAFQGRKAWETRRARR